MNPFYITWILLFATGCIGQLDSAGFQLLQMLKKINSEPSNLTLNIDSGNWTQSRTRWTTHEINHIWTINQFSLHEKFNTSEISSPMLHASTTDKYEWYVKIIPNYISDGKETFSLWISLSDNGKIREAIAEFNVSIINEQKQKLFEASCSPKDFKLRGWGWPEFCQKDDFFRTKLLQNDTLILFIYIRWITAFTNDVPRQLKISSFNPTPETTATKSNLFENLQSLLGNPKFADVVFITNGSSYPAHKIILAARSPVFDDMFQQKDSKNGKLKKIRVNVTYMNEKVLQAMLRYIYTGECEQLGELTDELFEAATEYGLDGFRENCQQT